LVADGVLGVRAGPDHPADLALADAVADADIHAVLLA